MLARADSEKFLADGTPDRSHCSRGEAGRLWRTPPPLDFLWIMGDEGEMSRGMPIADCQMPNEEGRAVVFAAKAAKGSGMWMSENVRKCPGFARGYFFSLGWV
jgi:hypothetical protein